MQNEICPRRARRRKAHRRGSQQAGRIGRAKGKRGRSFCGLWMLGHANLKKLDGRYPAICASFYITCEINTRITLTG